MSTITMNASIHNTIELAADAVAKRAQYKAEREKTFDYALAYALAVQLLPRTHKSYVGGRVKLVYSTANGERHESNPASETANHEACRVVSMAYEKWLRRNYLQFKPGTAYTSEYCTREAVRFWFRSKRERMTRRALTSAEKKAGLTLGKNAERLAPRRGRGGKPINLDTLVSRNLGDVLLDLPPSLPENLAVVVRLLARKTRPTDIAVMLGVHRRSIYKMIASLARYLVDAEDTSATRRALRVAKLESLEQAAQRAAWGSGYRSQLRERTLPTTEYRGPVAEQYGPLYRHAPVTLTAQADAKVASAVEHDSRLAAQHAADRLATTAAIAKLPGTGRLEFSGLGYPLSYGSKLQDTAHVSKKTLLAKAKAARVKLRAAAKLAKAVKAGANAATVADDNDDNDCGPI